MFKVMPNLIAVNNKALRKYKLSFSFLVIFTQKLDIKNICYKYAYIKIFFFSTNV